MIGPGARSSPELLAWQAQQYISDELLRLVKVALDGVCDCSVDADAPHVIDINYPAAFPDDYLRPEVRLEIGPLASWLPYEERWISCGRVVSEGV